MLSSKKSIDDFRRIWSQVLSYYNTMVNAPAANLCAVGLFVLGPIMIGGLLHFCVSSLFAVFGISGLVFLGHAVIRAIFYRKEEPSPIHIESPEAFRRVNHSDSYINWKPLEDRGLAKEIRKQMGVFRRGRWCLYVIDALEEHNTTGNFRVVPLLGQPLFLRFHPLARPKDYVEIDQAVRDHLAASKVFAESPLESCLVPMRSRDGLRILDVELRIGGKAVKWLEVFACAMDAHHFPAESKEQLLSYARMLGAVQAAINTRPINKEQLNRVAAQTRWAFDEDFRALRDQYLAISAICAYAQSLPTDHPISVFRSDEREIKAWITSCEEAWSSIEGEERGWFVHDMHPHNVMFRDHTCGLIYDFDLIERWRHGDVVAYSLHRFIRELVRRLRVQKSDIPALATAFVDAYTERGPPLPNDFLKTLHIRIAFMTLCKLRSNMMSTLGVKASPSGRDNYTRAAELVKFISFLKETVHFKCG